jgi:myo-inositol-1(or 4)-monophosphatase
LVEGGVTLLGVIDMPFLGMLYTGAKGFGAECNGQPISGSRCSRLSDAIVAIGDYAVGDNAPIKNSTRLALTGLLLRAFSGCECSARPRPISPG